MAVSAPGKSGIRKISVIIPAFNAADFLEVCIGSALEAIKVAESNFGTEGEIIIVDDKSTDDTLERANSIANRVSRCFVLPLKENGGAGRARNYGASQATGDILCFLDHDDRYEPHHLTTCLAMFDAVPQAGFARTGVFVESPMHPSRYEEMTATIPTNLAIRREVFDFVGGFGEAEPFRRLHSMEDSWLAFLIMKRFIQARTDTKTVVHGWREGNHLHRRHSLNQTPATKIADVSWMTPAQREARSDVLALLAQYDEELMAMDLFVAPAGRYAFRDGEPNKFVLAMRYG